MIVFYVYLTLYAIYMFVYLLGHFVFEGKDSFLNELTPYRFVKEFFTWWIVVGFFIERSIKSRV